MTDFAEIRSQENSVSQHFVQDYTSIANLIPSNYEITSSEAIYWYLFIQSMKIGQIGLKSKEIVLSVIKTIKFQNRSIVLNLMFEIRLIMEHLANCIPKLHSQMGKAVQRTLTECDKIYFFNLMSASQLLNTLIHKSNFSFQNLDTLTNYEYSLFAIFFRIKCNKNSSASRVTLNKIASFTL